MNAWMIPPVGVLAVALLLVGCGQETSPSDTVPGGENGSSELSENNDMESVEKESATTVTLGVYLKKDDGSYTNTGKDLVFEVGVECYTWTRTAPADSFDSGPHDHHNAADETTLIDGVFTWTEYGPEHTRGEIDTLCAGGTGGTTKTADEIHYTQDKNFYLKIDKIE